MNRVDPFDGLQFDNNTALDQHVELQLGVNSVPLVFEGNTAFALGLQGIFPELDEQAFSIHRFQQPRTQNPVYLNGATNNTVAYPFRIGSV